MKMHGVKLNDNFIMSSEAFNQYVAEFADGNPNNIEAIHLVQVGSALNKAKRTGQPSEAVDYLQSLNDEIVSFWKKKIWRKRCPACGK